VFLRKRTWSLLIGVGFLVLTAGCATLQQFSALGDVDFSLDRVSGLRLAGVELDRIRSYQDLGLVDVAALALAITRNQLPMEFDLHVLAENPSDNSVQARLLRMDWTLLLQDKETLSGVLEDEVILPPGEPRDIPIPISLNLIEFFDGSAQDLFELALSVAGLGGESKDVALKASPVVDTPLGAIRYPQPITILSTKVGGSDN
jgi:hypothetical protein